MSKPSIQKLADLIHEKTTRINSYIEEHNLPPPSFDGDGPLDSPVPRSEAALEADRVEVVEALDELRALLMGPKEYLLSFGHSDLIIQQAVSRFNLAHAVPAEGDVSYADIAKKTGLDEVQAQRLLRFGMSRRIFKESRRGFVAHTAASRAMLEDSDLLDSVGFYSDEMWPAASQTCNAIEKWPGSGEPLETGFALANRTDKTFHDYMKEHPERGKRYRGTLARRAKVMPGYTLDWVADLFPWAEVGDGTVIDLGGSYGETASFLAKRFPRLKFIVQDRTEAVEGGEANLDPELKGRLSFQVHDMFTPQKVSADVYFLKQVFHNWSDKYSIQILQNLVPALKKGARVVVCEVIMPDPGVLPLRIERGMRNLDISMLEFQNSRQREMDAWVEIFNKADKRFRLGHVGQNKAAVFSTLEFVWEG